MTWLSSEFVVIFSKVDGNIGWHYLSMPTMLPSHAEQYNGESGKIEQLLEIVDE